MARSKKGKKTSCISKVITLFFLAIVMIGSGIYLTYLNSPEKLFSYAFSSFVNQIEKIDFKEQTTGIVNNYSLTSNIDISMESQSIQNSLLQEDLENKNFINNINNTKSTLNIIQDTNNKKMFVSLNTKLQEEEILDTKYLIEDSTEYYYVKDIVPNYINNGNSTYFEALTSNTTNKDNILYILNTVSKSLSKHIKEEYVIVTKEKIDIDNKQKELNKISLELNNQTTKTLAKNILKDLKDDTISNRILTSYDDEFNKFKITDDTKILSKNQKVIINLYTNVFGKVEKYELIHKEKEDEYKITYTPRNKEIYIIENNEVIYRIESDIKNAKQIYTFYNSKDQEQGKLVYEKTKDRTTASINLHTKEKTIEVLYDSKIENLKKNKSYDNSIVFTLKESNKTDNLLSIDINIENKISTDLTIEEDTSNAIFASSVTEEQKTMLSQKKDNILLRLKG